MPQRRIILSLLVLVSLGLAILILADIWPFLRGPAPETSDWYWPYSLRPVARWWPLIICLLGLIAFGTWWTQAGVKAAGPLAILSLLTLLVLLAVVYADRTNIGAELVDRTLSKDTNGYAAVAGEIPELSPVLRQFPNLMATFDNEHARTHPPGLIAIYWMLERGLKNFPQLSHWLAIPVRFWRCADLWVLTRPASSAASLFLGAILPIVAAAFVPLMAYYTGRRMFAESSARLGALLAAATPALLVFSPTPDQIFALLSLISLWLVLKGLDRNLLLFLGLAGLVLSVMTMLSLGNMVWMVLVIAFLGIESWRRRRHHTEIVLALVVLIAGSSSLWLIYWLGWGVAPWQIVLTGLDQHYLLVTRLREYSTWLTYNPLDFLIFAGLAVTIGLIAQFAWSISGSGRGREKAGILAILLTGTILLLNLSGGTRGEVGRLWLVYMPLAAVIAGGFWAERTHGRLETGMLLTSQLLVVLAISLAWRPLQAVILPVVPPEFSEHPDTMIPARVAFQQNSDVSMILTGYEISGSFAAGNTIEVLLAWLGQGPTFEPYTVFVHVIDADGGLITQSDNWPAGGTWPTTCWTDGEAVLDRHAIRLPVDLPAGPYRMVVGVYDADTAERLRTPDGQDTVTLERFE